MGSKVGGTEENVELKSEELKTEEQEKQTSGFGQKLAGLAIKGLLVAGGIYVFGNLQDNKKDSFLAEYKENRILQCESDRDCVSMVDANFDECADSTISSRRRGKYNRDYRIDDRDFELCLVVSSVMINIEQHAEADDL